jgi:hypothetical protein
MALSRRGEPRFERVHLARGAGQRRIYLAVGINISIASVLSIVHSPRVAAIHRRLVGVPMVWFAATGF